MIIKATDIAKSVGLPENVLMFRPYGEKAYKIILYKIENELNPREIVEIDFTGIESSDLSFLDEVVLTLQLYIREKTNNILFLSNLSDDTLASLIGVIGYKYTVSKIKVPILYKVDKRFTIIGGIEPILQETFDLFYSFRNEISAKELAQLKNLAMNNACMRLKKLYDLGLVNREDRNEIYYKLPNI